MLFTEQSMLSGVTNPLEKIQQAFEFLSYVSNEFGSKKSPEEKDMIRQQNYQKMNDFILGLTSIYPKILRLAYRTNKTRPVHEFLVATLQVISDVTFWTKFVLACLPHQIVPYDPEIHNKPENKVIIEENPAKKAMRQKQADAEALAAAQAAAQLMEQKKKEKEIDAQRQIHLEREQQRIKFEQEKILQKQQEIQSRKKQPEPDVDEFEGFYIIKYDKDKSSSRENNPSGSPPVQCTPPLPSFLPFSFFFLPFSFPLFAFPFSSDYPLAVSLFSSFYGILRLSSLFILFFHLPPELLYAYS